MSFWSDFYHWFFPKKPPVVVVPPKVPPVTTPPAPPVTTPPVKPPVVTPPVVTPTPPVVTPTPPVSTPPVSTTKVVFSAEFTDPDNWVVGKTSAYPGATNPGDHKLDRIGPDFAPTGAGEFLATRRDDGTWAADLVTTEGSKNGFKVKPGDVLEAQVTVAITAGAWPAIWTWSGPSGEVDAFEYHPDNPTLLELSNHTQGNDGSYYDWAAGTVTPGKTFGLQVSFLTTGVEWSVDGNHVFTSTGVPANWSAYLIVNLSVSDGTYHPAPDAATSQLNFTVKGLTVSR